MENESNKATPHHETQDSSVDFALNDLFSAVEQLSQKIQPFIEALSEGLSRFNKAVQPFLEAIAPYIRAFVRYQKFIDSVGVTGWLPYHTLSLSYVEQCGHDAALLDRQILLYYTEHWSSIRHDIEKRLESYNISDATRDTFREGMDAHEIGHYRCVCSALFPVIDREFRIHFFEDSAGAISSKRMLEQLTNRGSIGDFMPRVAYGWMLFPRLVHHLYEPIDDSNKLKYEQDYVPNRHAVSHGLLSYSTHKHSMNMIIMTDYIFQLFTSTGGSSLRD